MSTQIRCDLRRRILREGLAMYESYWGLSRSPFTSPTARQFLVGSAVHGEALARLEFLRESRSPLGLLVGPSGSGKSAVLAESFQRATRAGALTGLIATAAADEAQVLPVLASALHVDTGGDLSATWRGVAERLAELRFDNLTALLLLDDLDRATAGTLALVERLLALPDVPLTLVAAALPTSLGRLGFRLLEQSVLRIELTPWSEEESREYLDRSLTAAGRLQPAFDGAATRRLFELSGGAPRRLNQL